MPEPISIILSVGLGLGYATSSYRRTDSAVSSEGQLSGNAVATVMKAAEESWALFGQKSKALSQLRVMLNECFGENWDGSGAVAIDPLTAANVEDFIRTIPNDLPLPEFAPEPDGSISLDWIQSRYRIFSLSISSSSRVAYAWLDGTEKGHGVAHFDGLTFPPHVQSELRSIVRK